jgi:hypothetical protein
VIVSTEAHAFGEDERPESEAQKTLVIATDRAGTNRVSFSSGRFAGGGTVLSFGTEETKENEVAQEPVPLQRLYPHVFDTDMPSARSIASVRTAVSDARSAVDAFDDADLAEVGSRLALIASSMAQAQEAADFNQGFRAVVAYIRRAMLVCGGGYNIGREALHALITVLRQLSDKPVLTLQEGAKLVSELSHVGWRGEHAAASEVINALLGREDNEPEAEADSREVRMALPRE